MDKWLYWKWNLWASLFRNHLGGGGSHTFIVLYKMSSFAPAFIVLSQFKRQSGIQNAELWICVTQDESRKNLAYKLSSWAQNWIIFRDRVWTRKRLPIGRPLIFNLSRNISQFIFLRKFDVDLHCFRQGYLEKCWSVKWIERVQPSGAKLIT